MAYQGDVQIKSRKMAWMDGTQSAETGNPAVRLMWMEGGGQKFNLACPVGLFEGRKEKIKGKVEGM